MLLSKTVAQRLHFSQEESAALLSLGNTARSKANRDRNFSKVAEDIFNLNKYDDLKQHLNQTPTEAYLSDYQAALAFYDEAANLSRLPITTIQAKLNHLSLLLQISQELNKINQDINKNRQSNKDRSSQEQKLFGGINSNLNIKTNSLVSDILPQISTLPNNHTGIYAKINFAQILINLIKLQLNLEPNKWFQEAKTLLDNSIQQAHILGDKRAEANAIGSLGELYEYVAKYPEAKYKTEQALKVLIADVSTDNRDIAYNLSWQLGRILKAQGNSKTALGAYDIAFQNLKPLRSDLVAINQDIQFDFKERVEPFYREFIGLLLQSDKPLPKDIDKAREVIESFQLAELDNYFQNPCSQIKQNKIDDLIDHNTQKSAAIYPIIFPDRLDMEIILKLPNTNLLHYRQRLPQDFTKTLERLYETLYIDSKNIFKDSAQDKIEALEKNKAELLPLLKKVHSWLINPIEGDLQKSQIETLVFVLNSPLQTIPIAALYDGKQYLVEKYKVVFTPGLQLTESKGLQSKLEVLAAGVAKKIQDLPPLLGVKNELNKIQSLLPRSTTILLDEEFTKKNLIEKLKSPFSVLHFATHGQFSSNPNETYIFTEDSKILGNELDQLLRARNSSSFSPLELLVLSACETAKGDQRAVLGLAGIAVRAGARSTLATLWNVEDESAAVLMGEFYKVLKTKVSKAEALRKAQLDLLMNPKYEHPAYWAPYVLVGNWN